MTGRARHSCLGLVFLMMPALVGGCWWYPTSIRMSRTKAWTSAWDALQRASQDQSATVRWMAIEALAQTVGSQGGEVYVRGLSDAAPSVRASAAMAVGDIGYTGAKTTLKAMAEARGRRFWESDRRTYCAVIYSLHRLGDNTHVQDLGKLLWDKESEVRATAALVMGKMGEPSAVGPLKMLLNDEEDPMVQIQAVESLALLGDERARSMLEAYTKTRFIDEQILAIQAMARAKGPRAIYVIRRQMADKHPPRARVVAAGALGRLGEFSLSGYNLCIDSVRKPESVLKWSFGRTLQDVEEHAKSLRQLAATALGWVGRDGAVDYLYPLLQNEDGRIRVAAAMSILRLLREQTAKMRRHTPAPPRRRLWRIPK